MYFIVSDTTFFFLLLFSVDKTDHAAHEFLLNADSLTEVAPIPFNFHPTRILFDVDSDILLVKDSRDYKGKIRMGTKNQAGWTVTELARSNIEDIDIRCWSRMGINRIGLVDLTSSSVFVYEYE